MKRSHDHTQLKRLAAISLCLVMCLSALPMLAPPAAAWSMPQFYGGNATGHSGDSIELINHTFEKESVGDTPPMMYYSEYDGRVSVVDYAGVPYGRVWRIGNDGTSETDSYHSAMFLIGHDLSFNYTLSFDVRCLTPEGHANNSLIVSTVEREIPTLSTQRRPNLEIVISSNRIQTGSYMDAIKVDHDLSAWTHIEVIVDQPQKTRHLYVDGEYVGSETYNNEFSPRHILVRQSYTEGEASAWQLDNICVSTPRHNVQTLPSASLDDRTKISITFDNARKSVYDDCYPILQSYGYRGCVGVTIDLVGASDHPKYPGVEHMTWDDLRHLVGEGWEMMSHSVTHTDFTELDEEQQRAEHRQAIDAIRDQLGVEVLGFVFPHNTRTALTEHIAWDYYSYIAESDFDSKRQLGEHQDDPRWVERPYLVIPAIAYGHLGYIDFYTHGVGDNPKFEMAPEVFGEWVSMLHRYDAEVVTKAEYYELFRNARNAIAEGDATAFSISYPESHGNFTNGQVYAHMSVDVDDTYVAVQDGKVVSQANAVGGALTLLVGEGEYEIMTLSAYRQAQIIDSPIYPLYAVIPVVVVLAVLGGLFTMLGKAFGRLKF